MSRATTREREARRPARRGRRHEDTHTDDEAPADLFAEDVNRGYRLDVEDQKQPGRWLSLHHRVGDYLLQQDGRSRRSTTPESSPARRGLREGRVDRAVPGKEEDQYLHEAMFGWEGWSLAAKRPGQAITNTDAGASNGRGRGREPVPTCRW